MLRQAQHHLVRPRQQPLELGKSLGRDQNALSLSQHRGTGQVTHRQPVGVRRNQAESTFFSSHQHTGEHGPGVVRRCSPDNLAQGLRELAGLQRHCITHRNWQPWEIARGKGAHGKLRAPRGDPDLVLIPLDRHRARVQGAHDVGPEPGGNHHDAISEAGDGDLDMDREVQVAPRQAERFADHLEANPGESRQSPTPRGHGSSGCSERLDQDITLAAELHRRSLLLFLITTCFSKRQ